MKSFDPAAFDPADVNSFLSEIIGVCKKWKISLSHEDDHGAFLLMPYSEDLADWLVDADIDALPIRGTTDETF